MSDLLFEIGCEEIPAKMLARALREWPAHIEASLRAARLAYQAVAVMGTPRRLAVVVRALAAQQADLTETVVGPPAAVAFAADGSLSKAGQGWASKAGIDAATVVKTTVDGKKGEYAVATRFAAGGATEALLPAMLAAWIDGIAWPKSMRWGWSEARFVRPLAWLVALYGTKVVPVHWRHLVATRMSRGHRFLAPGAVEIGAAEDYEKNVAAAHVIVEPAARRTRVQAELARLAAATGFTIVPDEELLDEVQHLGEYPIGVMGSFLPSYLDVPREIIVTAMRTHQRYFAVVDAAGALANRFVTMLATKVEDEATVIRGNERVLAARLSDAAFFFHEDQKKPLRAWNEKLEHVVFQAKLGDRAKTIGHKVARLVAMVQALAPKIACDAQVAVAAAQLCKADLATGIVGEFPELQGIMGMHYVRRTMAGELGDATPAVATAVAEHYMPKGQGAALPSSNEAALVALADRVDTLVGCFATGLAPSGSADPLGLRRAAVGVLAILLDRGDKGLTLTVDALVDASIAAYGDALAAASGRRELMAFFAQRLRGLVADGTPAIDANTLDVAMGASRTALDVRDVVVRARALLHVPETVRAAFKRIANILDDAAAKQLTPSAAVDPAQFAGPAGVEANLWQAFTSRQAALDAALREQRYGAAFDVLAELGPAVAAFFDKGGVMVMDPNPVLRDNRLALLAAIFTPFARIADFRQLAT